MAMSLSAMPTVRMPEHMARIHSDTTKTGTLRYAEVAPTMVEVTTVTSMHAAIASHMGKSLLVMISAATSWATPQLGPMEKSIPPWAYTNEAPAATMVTEKHWLIRLVRLLLLSIFPCVTTVKNTNMKTRPENGIMFLSRSFLLAFLLSIS